MIENSESKDPLKEFRKRRRETFAVFFLAAMVVFLTWFEIRLFSISETLPFVHSIFFFGLVNFNIILLLFLLFLIFRNLVKVFVEQRGGFFGSTLKAKLTASFVALSSIPTILLLVTSVFYVNMSFEKWFSVKMAGVLKSSLEVTNAYYFNAKKKNYHFAHQIAIELRKPRSSDEVRRLMGSLRNRYSLDAVEYYPDLFGGRELLVSEEDVIPLIPRGSLEFLQKGIKAQVDASTIHQFGEGNLVRVIVPVKEGANMGAVVVSSFVPLSLISKMNDISSAYEEFRDTNPLQYPLKSIYLIITVLMTLVVLLAATWFGFYLAQQLSGPLVQLGRAAMRIAAGEYAQVNVKSGSDEINQLVDSFNQMSRNLETSEKEVRDANQNMQRTLQDLDEHNRYIEVVLGSVSAGVISVDQTGKITTINKRGGDLLNIKPGDFIGRPVRELLTLEYFRKFAELLKLMQDHQIESIQREIQVSIRNEVVPLLLTLSILKNDQGTELGKVLVFDDLTPIVSAQRAAAWTEVARRIAHEIKNPLTPIKLSAERLQRKFGDSIQDPAFGECTRMIVRQAEELKNLVNEFSQFARMPQAKPVMGSMNQTIQEAVAVFKNLDESPTGPVEWRLQLSEDLPSFRFDPNQLNRVLVNLIDNSLAAMNHNKTLNQCLEISTVYDSDLNILRLTVADNGPGVPNAERPRIFEPYFTTKEGGTGLGLAIVKRVIEDHNGFIRALSNDPTGLKIVMELPVHTAEDWKPLQNAGKGTPFKA